MAKESAWGSTYPLVQKNKSGATLVGRQMNFGIHNEKAAFQIIFNIRTDKPGSPLLLLQEVALPMKTHVTVKGYGMHVVWFA